MINVVRPILALSNASCTTCLKGNFKVIQVKIVFDHLSNKKMRNRIQMYLTFSLSVSKAEVASSSRSILGLRINARAMAILCF